MDYYGAVTMLTLILAGLMLVHTFRSDILRPEQNRSFAGAFLLIMILALTEWLGVAMNGMPSYLSFLHVFIKVLEYTLTPVLMISFCVDFFNARFPRVLWGLCLIHGVLEVITLFTGFIVYVDENNVYRHGPWYGIYITAYGLSLMLLIFCAVVYGMKNQNRDIRSLFAVFFILLAGVAVQLFNSSVRIDWITGAVSTTLLYMYYSELAQRVDETTDLFNRRSYERRLKKIRYKTTVLIFDIDDFKKVNDTYGHVFGDEVLNIVGSCILRVYSSKGFCFRIGGDEFCVILKKRRREELPEKHILPKLPKEAVIEDMPSPTALIRNLNHRFEKALQVARQKEPRLPEVSLGYAFYDGEESIEQAVARADALMYEKKKRRKQAKNPLPVK